jgi:hypothetical protein
MLAIRVERAATPTGPVQRHFFRDKVGRIAVWDSPGQRLECGRASFEVVIAENARFDGRPVTVLAGCRATA